MTKKTTEAERLYLYAFPHRGLNGIYRTVQTSHAVAELLSEPKSANAGGLDWANNHKTMILMEGLNSAGLKKLVGILEKSDFAWADFHEDQETMDGIRTCVVVVVDKNKSYDDSLAGMKLVEFMKNCKLASN